MARYILDTGILVGYLRGAEYAGYVEQVHSPFKPPNVCATSVVSAGELLSLAAQQNWREERRRMLSELLLKVPRLGINYNEIIARYAEIDSFSQGKNPSKPLGQSSRNMGKNDLWIAATASVLDASLLTTDRDFDHLDNVFLHVIHIDQSSKRT